MSSLSGKTILIVDDAPDILLLTRKILQGDGATVLGAPDVGAGLDLALQRLPHLIITDLHMPGHDGFKLLEAHRAAPTLRSIPVLVSSGLNDRTSVHRAISMGAAGYLLKPFRAALLLQKVKKALNSSGFWSYRFPKGEAPSVKAVLPAEIHQVNETGYMLETAIKLGPDAPVEVDAPLIAELGAHEAFQRTTVAPSRFRGAGRYMNEVNFVGVSEKTTRHIRALLKGWPTS